MTKYVLVSDIHANYPAFKAVVNAEGKSANYLILGDLLGLNGYPDETIDLVRSLNAPTLSGNHDVALLQRGEGHVQNDALSEYELNHTEEQLSESNLSWVQSLQSMEVLETEEGTICITHAKPYPEKASGYQTGNEGVSTKKVTHHASRVSDKYDFVFHGHTHEQYDLDCEQFGHAVHFVSPGTLGYDGTYTVVDTNTGEVMHKSVQYDEEAVKEHIKELLPDKAPPVSRWY